MEAAVARRADLDVVLRRADALVTKAAAVAKDAATREAADAADTEEELAKLKAAIVAAKEKDASKEEDAKRDAAAAKAKAKVSRPSLAIEMGAESGPMMTPECAVVKLMLCLAYPNLPLTVPLAGEL